MAKNKNLAYGAIALLFLLVLSAYFWNSYQIQERDGKPVKLPPQISGKCGMENCHGLDIVCGPNVPDACTAIYMAGDNCRQYAVCQTVGGQCILEKTPKFDSCKSCTEKCGIDYTDSPMEFFQCESRCAEQDKI